MISGSVSYWVFAGVPENKVRKIKSQQIIDAVVRKTGITHDEMKEKSRKRRIVLARQLCYAFLRKHTKLPLNDIADLFLGQDHTTVIHSINTINNGVATDEEIKELYESIEQSL